jgi:hypothetical protein
MDIEKEFETILPKLLRFDQRDEKGKAKRLAEATRFLKELSAENKEKLVRLFSLFEDFERRFEKVAGIGFLLDPFEVAKWEEDNLTGYMPGIDISSNLTDLFLIIRPADENAFLVTELIDGGNDEEYFVFDEDMKLVEVPKKREFQKGTPLVDYLESVVPRPRKAAVPFGGYNKTALPGKYPQVTVVGRPEADLTREKVTGLEVDCR